MTLTLKFTGKATVPVEVEGVTPDALRDKSLAEIEQFPIFHGNNKIPLADFFDVKGDPKSQHHVWQGDLKGVHWIGAKMRSGEVVVEGDGGRHIGSEMRGGSIDVSGNAGDWVGGEMRGGRIRIQGNAGHLVGAAYRGSPRGMTRGTILVHGNVGNEVGHTLRRGTIAVAGNCGDLAGFNMLAGSVFVFGEAGIRHGAGMRRGTIGFFGQSPPLLPSFVRATRFRPDVMELMFRFLTEQGFPVPAEMERAEFHLYHGDLIEGGRGEILLTA